MRQRLAEFVQSPLYTATGSYTVVPNCSLDTGYQGQKSIFYQVLAGGSGATVKLQASIDNTNWTDLQAYDQTGAQLGGTSVNVNTGAYAYMVVAPELNASLSAFRYYQVVVKTYVTVTTTSTTSTTTPPPAFSTVIVAGFMKP